MTAGLNTPPSHLEEQLREALVSLEQACEEEKVELQAKWAADVEAAVRREEEKQKGVEQEWAASRRELSARTKELEDQVLERDEWVAHERRLNEELTRGKEDAEARRAAVEAELSNMREFFVW